MFCIISLFLPSSALLPQGSGCFQFNCNLDPNAPLVLVNTTSRQIFISACLQNTQSGNPFIDYSSNETNWNTLYCNTTSPVSENRTNLYTGQKCVLDANCLSVNCLDGICLGLPDGSSCTASDECLPGSYCESDTFICALCKSYDDYCTLDEECPIGGGCNQGLCTALFSLQTNSVASDAKFCQSNFLVDGYCDILTLQIKDSEFALYSPFMCVENEVCQYILSNGTVFDEQPCMCGGFHNLPEGFCGHYLVNVDTVMTPVYKALQYSTSTCSGHGAHTVNPTEMLDCGAIPYNTFVFYWNIYNQSNYWNIFITGSLDSCSYGFGFWDPYYTYSNFGGAKMVTMAAFFLFLVNF
jgi:hypothetical protein